jgi:hypothetical protein
LAEPRTDPIAARLLGTVWRKLRHRDTADLRRTY